MSVKILAGRYKGMFIKTPCSAKPTLTRSRKVLFDVLESFSNNFGYFWKDKKIFDCFAGSGAFGIEALSRGASFAYFSDNNKQAIETIYKNIKQLKAENLCSVMLGDISQLKVSNKYYPEICDILFFDPPYGKVSISRTINHLKNQGWLSQTSILITEEDKRNTEDLSTYICLKSKEIGNSLYKFLRI